MEIVLHSYTFRDYSLEDALRAARRLGYTGIELHPVHFNPSYADEELGRCMVLADRRGLDISVVDFKADLTQADAAAAREAAESLQRLISSCAKYGIERVNGFTGFLAGANASDFSQNGSAIASDEQYARCAEHLRRVARVAADAGVTVTLEIHMNTIHDTVASTLRLLGLVDSPAVLATPDPGNMFATCPADRDPAALESLRGKIGHVHLKNCAFRAGVYDFSVPLPGGDIDIYRHLRQLQSMRYTGPLCLEYVGSGDPHVPASADIDYLKRCLAWLHEADSNG